MAEDLFGAALQERLRRQAPLAARLRPATLDEVVGQEHLLGPGRPLRRLIESDRLSSVILWGPPGTGKTTLAKLIAGATSRAFETLSAVTAGVKDVREVLARARTRLGEQGQGTILFLDEVHRFNQSQQNALEVAIALAGEGKRVGLAEAEAALDARALRYERDEHYDIVSAFIKSVRGSDPDAGLYWLARMLEAGEDARFIARRLVILASEDIGMADPMSLVVDDAAARAVEFVGLPEAQLNLAKAVVHLATAPKSNRVIAALGRAQGDVKDRPAGEVPMHLRSSSYYGAKKLGHGIGYEYPHDDPRGWVPQEHRPPEVAGRVYYEPSDHGFEREIAERMRAREENQE